MSQELASRLKAEGNVHFASKQWTDAHSKYTQAIALDERNAVLYANRAACNIHMRKYMDAASDATLATEYDPTYARGWARRATAEDALKEFYRSVISWKRALEALPAANLNPAERTQKDQYEAGLKKAQAEKASAESTTLGDIPLKRTEKGKFPHDMALQIMPQLRRTTGTVVDRGSAWVMCGAVLEFNKGVDLMKEIKRGTVQGPNGPRTSYTGKTGAVVDIVNGLLRDHRAFHIDTPKWFNLYNDQVSFELMSFRAWPHAGPEQLQQEVLERQRQEGWDAVRPALAVTIRGWILRGFVQGALKNDQNVAVEFLTCAVDVLNWGRRVWKDVHRDNRGAIFDTSFVRGVRHMRLQAYMQAYATSGWKSECTLEDLLEEAEDILRDIEKNPLPRDTNHDPGFYLSFETYPRGRALAMKGFYHDQTAKILQNEGKSSAAQEHFTKAAQYYLEAAAMYPEDDEQHAWFLHVALHDMWSCSTPLRITLEVLKRIRLTIPKMSKIWAQSSLALAGRRDELLQKDLESEKNALELLADGIVTLDACIR
ncbi:hypothetical protein PLICRDRAFT_105000 [Plicaturopsis crispa FD-325 SS-3]|nr:hypothetical protein PLICRDRAFT_105000 [Plicaturopsis crispa FD-325 SS-3]